MNNFDLNSFFLTEFKFKVGEVVTVSKMHCKWLRIVCLHIIAPRKQCYYITDPVLKICAM